MNRTKLYLIVLAMLGLSIAMMLTGCEGVETVPVEKNLETLSPLSGNVLEKEHEVEDFKFVTTYNTGSYNLSRWRITDSKLINMYAKAVDVPGGAIVLVEHVHVDMSLKSTNPQLDGLTQDSMDDSYHGTSQDGFWIVKYPYDNKFAVEGFSKDLIDGWMFVCGSYGYGNISQERLTERNLVKYGNVYANKMQVVYDLLIKYDGEELYHTVSVSDEFLIPVKADAE